MLGKVITEHGQVVNNQDIMVVHLHLKEGETIAPHNHPGRRIFFTVVEGEVEVYLNEEETYPLVPKKVLEFDGEVRISISFTFSFLLVLAFFTVKVALSFSMLKLLLSSKFE